MAFRLPHLGIPILVEGAPLAVRELRIIRKEYGLLRAAIAAPMIGGIIGGGALLSGGASILGGIGRGARGIGRGLLIGSGFGLAGGVVKSLKRIMQQISDENDRAISGMLKQWEKFKDAMIKLFTKLTSIVAPFAEVALKGATSIVNAASKGISKVGSQNVLISIFNLAKRVASVLVQMAAVMVKAGNVMIAMATARVFSKPTQEQLNDAEKRRQMVRGMKSFATDLTTPGFGEGPITDIMKRNSSQALLDFFTGTGGRVASAMTGVTSGQIRAWGQTAGRLGQGAVNTAAGGLTAARNFGLVNAIPWKIGQPAGGGMMGMPGIGGGIMNMMQPIMMAMGMQGQADNIKAFLAKAGGLNMSTLAATQAGSAEGFGQRVRAGREDEVLKISKQQLDTLRNMERMMRLQEPVTGLPGVDFAGLGVGGE